MPLTVGGHLCPPVTLVISHRCHYLRRPRGQGNPHPRTQHFNVSSRLRGCACQTHWRAESHLCVCSSTPAAVCGAGPETGPEAGPPKARLQHTRMPRAPPEAPGPTGTVRPREGGARYLGEPMSVTPTSLRNLTCWPMRTNTVCSQSDLPNPRTSTRGINAPKFKLRKPPNERPELFVLFRW